MKKSNLEIYYLFKILLVSRELPNPALHSQELLEPLLLLLRLDDGDFVQARGDLVEFRFSWPSDRGSHRVPDRSGHGVRPDCGRGGHLWAGV